MAMASPYCHDSNPLTDVNMSWMRVVMPEESNSQASADVTFARATEEKFQKPVSSQTDHHFARMKAALRALSDKGLATIPNTDKLQSSKEILYYFNLFFQPTIKIERIDKAIFNYRQQSESNEDDLGDADDYKEKVTGALNASVPTKAPLSSHRTTAAEVSHGSSCDGEFNDHGSLMIHSRHQGSSFVRNVISEAITSGCKGLSISELKVRPVNQCRKNIKANESVLERTKRILSKSCQPVTKFKSKGHGANRTISSRKNAKKLGWVSSSKGSLKLKLLRPKDRCQTSAKSLRPEQWETKPEDRELNSDIFTFDSESEGSSKSLANFSAKTSSKVQASINKATPVQSQPFSTKEQISEKCWEENTSISQLKKSVQRAKKSCYSDADHDRKLDKLIQHLKKTSRLKSKKKRGNIKNYHKKSSNKPNRPKKNGIKLDKYGSDRNLLMCNRKETQSSIVSDVTQALYLPGLIPSTRRSSAPDTIKTKETSSPSSDSRITHDLPHHNWLEQKYLPFQTDEEASLNEPNDKSHTRSDSTTGQDCSVDLNTLEPTENLETSQLTSVQESTDLLAHHVRGASTQDNSHLQSKMYKVPDTDKYISISSSVSAAETPQSIGRSVSNEATETAHESISSLSTITSSPEQKVQTATTSIDSASKLLPDTHSNVPYKSPRGGKIQTPEPPSQSLYSSPLQTGQEELQINMADGPPPLIEASPPKTSKRKSSSENAGSSPPKAKCLESEMPRSLEVEDNKFCQSSEGLVIDEVFSLTDKSLLLDLAFADITCQDPDVETNYCSMGEVETMLGSSNKLGNYERIVSNIDQSCLEESPITQCKEEKEDEPEHKDEAAMHTLDDIIDEALSNLKTIAASEEPESLRNDTLGTREGILERLESTITYPNLILNEAVDDEDDTLDEESDKLIIDEMPPADQSPTPETDQNSQTSSEKHGIQNTTDHANNLALCQTQPGDNKEQSSNIAQAEISKTSASISRNSTTDSNIPSLDSAHHESKGTRKPEQTEKKQCIPTDSNSKSLRIVEIQNVPENDEEHVSANDSSPLKIKQAPDIKAVTKPNLPVHPVARLTPIISKQTKKNVPPSSLADGQQPVSGQQGTGVDLRSDVNEIKAKIIKHERELRTLMALARMKEKEKQLLRDRIRKVQLDMTAMKTLYKEARERMLQRNAAKTATESLNNSENSLLEVVDLTTESDQPIETKDKTERQSENSGSPNPPPVPETADPHPHPTINALPAHSRETSVKVIVRPSPPAAHSTKADYNMYTYMQCKIPSAKTDRKKSCSCEETPQTIEPRSDSDGASTISTKSQPIHSDNNTDQTPCAVPSTSNPGSSPVQSSVKSTSTADTEEFQREHDGEKSKSLKSSKVSTEVPVEQRSTHNKPTAARRRYKRKHASSQSTHQPHATKNIDIAANIPAELFQAMPNKQAFSQGNPNNNTYLLETSRRNSNCAVSNTLMVPNATPIVSEQFRPNTQGHLVLNMPVPSSSHLPRLPAPQHHILHSVQPVAPFPHQQGFTKPQNVVVSRHMISFQGPTIPQQGQQFFNEKNVQQTHVNQPRAPVPVPMQHQNAQLVENQVQTLSVEQVKEAQNQQNRSVLVNNSLRSMSDMVRGTVPEGSCTINGPVRFVPPTRFHVQPVAPQRQQFSPVAPTPQCHPGVPHRVPDNHFPPRQQIIQHTRGQIPVTAAVLSKCPPTYTESIQILPQENHAVSALTKSQVRPSVIPKSSTAQSQPSPAGDTPQKHVQIQIPATPMLCCNCEKSAIFLCSGCQKTSYCSVTCQHKDWGSHKKNCAQQN